MRANSSSGNAILDGFTITGANSNGAGYPQHGGGILITDSSPTLRNLLLSNNTAGLYGGGIYAFTSDHTVPEASYSKPTLTSVTFSNNVAIEGAGIYTENASPTMSREVFSGNNSLADSNGGAGGGMYSGTYYSTDAPCVLTLSDVTFSGNSARGGGGRREDRGLHTHDARPVERHHGHLHAGLFVHLGNQVRGGDINGDAGGERQSGADFVAIRGRPANWSRVNE